MGRDDINSKTRIDTGCPECNRVNDWIPSHLVEEYEHSETAQNEGIVSMTCQCGNILTYQVTLEGNEPVAFTLITR